MKRYFFGMFFLAAAISQAQAADVGVSVSIGQPGFYGQIDIGDNYPRPQVVYAQPRIIQPVIGVTQEPIYLRVPPGHAKRWSRYCGRYDACGRPVYFVQDNWYNQQYVPYYREHDGRGRDHDRDDHRGYGDHEHEDHDRGGDRGDHGNHGHHGHD